MLLSDAVQVFYGDDKKGNAKSISADDPRNMEFIKSLINN